MLRARRGDLLLDSAGRVRAGWRLAAYLLAMLLLAASSRLIPAGDRTTPGGLLLLTLRHALLVLAAGVPAWMLLRLVDRVPASSLGLSLHRRWGVELGQGLGIGLLLIGPILLVYALAGWVEVSPGEGGAVPLLILLALALLASSFEELVFRGYPFQVLAQSLGPWPAACLTSVLFGAAHLGNPGASPLSLGNTALAGLLLAVAYLRAGSLWLPIALHGSWNYSLGALSGLPVSGLEPPSSLARSTLTTAGERLHWLTGGAYGPEGGLLLTLLVLVALLAVARLPGFERAPGIEPLWRSEPAAPPPSPEES